MADTPLDRGFFAAGNNQYHGIESTREFGILDHAHQVARILLRDKKVSTEEEALAAASLTVKGLRWATEGYQVNRLARDELRRIQRENQNLFPTGACPVGT